MNCMNCDNTIPKLRMFMYHEFKKNKHLSCKFYWCVKWVMQIYIFFSLFILWLRMLWQREGVKNALRALYSRSRERSVPCGSARLEHADACWCARDSGVPRFRGIDRLPPLRGTLIQSCRHTHPPVCPIPATVHEM